MFSRRKVAAPTKGEEQMETKTDNLFAAITIDYSGFHGPVASGIVYDNDDLCKAPFYREVVMIGHNECESEWHDANCDCPTDDYYKEVFIEHMADSGRTIITNNEDGE